MVTTARQAKKNVKRAPKPKTAQKEKPHIFSTIISFLLFFWPFAWTVILIAKEYYSINLPFQFQPDNLLSLLFYSIFLALIFVRSKPMKIIFSLTFAVFLVAMVFMFYPYTSDQPATTIFLKIILPFLPINLFA